MRRYQVKSLTVDTGFGPVTLNDVPVYLDREDVPDQLGEGDYVLDLPTTELVYLSAAAEFLKKRRIVQALGNLTQAERDAIQEFVWVYGKILTNRMDDLEAVDALVHVVTNYKGRK